jgi:anti-sigma28 factor (negative regulator of flagellin synthesis)
MSRESANFLSGYLRSRGAKPINETAFMMISGLSSLASISFTPTTARAQAQAATGDQVTMSLSAETFSSLVQEASQMPDVRSDLVDSFKSRIQAGTYPTQATLDGVIDRMGGTWSAQADADSPGE